MLPRYHDVRARVVSGEFAIGMATDSFNDIAKGAPVRHANLDAVVVNSSGAFLLADSKNQAAAKLWGYWAVSAEG
jgi:ABC-type Fe3+ transport system substrate-binding protein